MTSIRWSLLFVALAVFITPSTAFEINIDPLGAVKKGLNSLKEGVKDIKDDVTGAVEGAVEGVKHVGEKIADKVGDIVHKEEGELSIAEKIKEKIAAGASKLGVKLPNLELMLGSKKILEMGQDGKDVLTDIKTRFMGLFDGLKQHREHLHDIREQLSAFHCPLPHLSGNVAADLGGLVGPFVGVADKVIGNIENDIDNMQTGGSLNSLAPFGAELDTLLDVPIHLKNKKLVRQRAQTAKNLTRYNTDFSEQIAASQNLHHQFFPNIETRAFDPTLLNGGDQLPELKNELAACLFQVPRPLLEKLSRNLFNRHGAMDTAEQGSWTDDIPGFSHLAGVWNRDLDIVQNLGARFEWKMNQYFSKAFNKAGANQDISLRYLYQFPDPSNGFSDELFAQFYFADFAQSFVRKVDPNTDKSADGATYVAPLDYTSTLDVQDSVGKYGCDVYFAEDASLMHIVYDGTTYKKDTTSAQVWENLKARCRGTAAMVETSIDHLLAVHLHFSNSLAMAVPLLPNNHNLRKLLWPHIFNAIGVNRKASVSLSIEGGLFSRGWGLNLAGVHKAYEYTLANNPLFNWHTPPEMQKVRGIDDSLHMPLYEDGNAFWKICKDYVTRYLAVHYENDEAIRNDAAIAEFHDNLNTHLLKGGLPAFDSADAISSALATYIYYVTGHHTHVGNLHLAAAQTGVAPSQWYEDGQLAANASPPNSDMWATITFIGTASLTLPITGDTCSTEHKCGFADKASYQNPAPPNAVHQPPIKAVGYPDLFDTDAEKAVNKRFVEDLLDLQKVIVARNKARHACKDGLVKAVCRPYNCFDVNWVEMSVGI